VKEFVDGYPVASAERSSFTAGFIMKKTLVVALSGGIKSGSLLNYAALCIWEGPFGQALGPEERMYNQRASGRNKPFR
jgi:hypothetical protein